MTAREVGEAIAAGVRDVYADAEIELFPMADGGDGSLDALEFAGWERHQVTALDALERTHLASYVQSGARCFVELAAVCGLTILGPQERNPWITTSRGLGSAAGELAQKNEVWLGLGGSASIDGGAGFLQGLGVTVVDRFGREIGPGLTGLAAAHAIGEPPAAASEMRFLTDVGSPLLGQRGAIALFGAQKGLRDYAAAEAILAQWVDLLEAWCGYPVANVSGAGAAGGIGAAALALGARLESGASVIAELLGLERALEAADLVITGEGALDRGTLEGKAAWIVGQLAVDKPVLFVAGSCDDSRVFEDLGLHVCAGSGDVLAESEIRRLVASTLAKA